MEKYRTKITCKLLALMLAVAVGVTFAPIYGNAYAADEDQAPDAVSQDEAIAEGDEVGYMGITDDADAMVLGETASNSEAKGYLAGVPSNYIVKSPYVSRKGNKAIVTGTLAAPYYFGAIFVDDGNTKVATINAYNVNCTIDLTKYGYKTHTIYLQVISSQTGEVEELYKIEQTPVRITAAPTYKGQMTVYWNYLDFAPYNMARANSAYTLYMEYSADGGRTWTRSVPMNCNPIQLYISQTYKISGLRPNTIYRTRLFYGQTLYGEFMRGPVLNTATIKTGQAVRPAIKSVTCKATKVKHHKVKHYGYYTGVYLYTEKFYTYNVKVTVKLKKKPGTTGIWINGRFLPGNKKKYTTTFTPYPNYSSKKPKGRVKFKVNISSYQNAGYGGFCPLYTVTKKVK